MSRAGFLAVPPETSEARKSFDADVDQMGFVMNVSRLWAYQQHTFDGLTDLMWQTSAAHGLTARQRGILVTATASATGDSYCALSWGMKLAKVSSPDLAASVLAGDDAGLTDAERAMARWARRVVREPNATAEADLGELREAGFDDAVIFAMTVFVALRLAFSTVNDALGVRPDAELRTAAPRAVREAVTYGRPIADGPATGG